MNSVIKFVEQFNYDSVSAAEDTSSYALTEGCL